jgi:hypothetical protein
MLHASLQDITRRYVYQHPDEHFYKDKQHDQGCYAHAHKGLLKQVMTTTFGRLGRPSEDPRRGNAITY